MSNSKKMFILTELLLAVMVIIVAFLMMREKNSGNQDTISVIIQDSEDGQWSAFKYGLRMAAEDLGVEMVVVSTEEKLSVQEQQSLIENEIENGADAVIVQPAWGAGAEEMLQKIEKRIPIMLVEYTASREKDASALPAVRPDNGGMGTALAEEILKDYEGNLKGKTMGIVSSTLDTEAALNRQEGFLDVLEGKGVEILWTLSGGEGLAEEEEKVDFVIALDDHSLIDAGRAAQANNLHGAVVYGIGNSTEAVYYLDMGMVECLVVPDEFNVGYQSIQEVVRKRGRLFRKMESIEVSYTVMRRENLFSDKNQEILFTMNQ